MESKGGKEAGIDGDKALQERWLALSTSLGYFPQIPKMLALPPPS